MTTELWVLVALVLMSYAIALGPLSMALMNRYGLPGLMGNREEFQPLDGWGGRLERAYQNLTVNLLLYACIALTLAVTEMSNEASATAALVFLAARIVHLLSYGFGIKMVRTLAYLTGFAATIIMVLQLL